VKALLVNCTLKASPEKSNAEALAEVVAEAMRGRPSSIAQRVLGARRGLLGNRGGSRVVALDRQGCGGEPAGGGPGARGQADPGAAF